MINLDKYKTINEIGFYKNIPISHLSEVREHFRKEGVNIRIRYRGSRTNPQDTRRQSQRYQDCLAQFAERFSVYIEGKHNKIYTKPPEPIKQARKYFTFHEAVIVERVILAHSLEEAKRACPSGLFVSMREVGL
jgi:hypothetical protein